MESFAGRVYGLEVPPGEDFIHASEGLPFSIRITMAAIDPTAAPEADANGKVPEVPRSTLRIIRSAVMEDDDDIDDDLMALLRAEQDDDEPNGGPSDPVKAKQKRSEAALQKLLESVNDDEDSDDEMTDAKTNGIKANGSKLSKKGKEKALDVSDDEDDYDDSDGEDIETEQFVLCTLDTQRTYQQPLDITIRANERVFFAVSGTHAVYLTGNYIAPDEDDEDDEDEYDDEYDLGPLEVDGSSDAESDELDDLADPRITEIESEDDEEIPQLIDTKPKKGKNKRPAEDEPENLDELISKDTKADAKAAKQQQKKMKNNKGQAVVAEEAAKVAETPKDSSKADKKVQFAKQLEQGPTGSAEKPKPKPKPTPTVREQQGVTIDDRTLGKGRVVKSGDTVSVRYIGKLIDGKVFDANKKGKPFTFQVGKGQVIKGWDVGIIGMQAGGERRLTVPAKLAYGTKKMGEIPGNSTLKFDVKLLEVK